MGEVIDSWKAKVKLGIPISLTLYAIYVPLLHFVGNLQVSASLIVGETTERTTRRVIVDTVHRVLHDLLTAFAAMEDYRRSNSMLALQEFKGISKIVMQTLKSCLY